MYPLVSGFIGLVSYYLFLESACKNGNKEIDRVIRFLYAIVAIGFGVIGTLGMIGFAIPFLE